MQILYHTCGQALDVAEKLTAGFASNQFVFLDAQTGDGYDRCPRCQRDLKITNFRCQAAVVSHAKRTARRKPTAAVREATRLIRRARKLARQAVAS
jgi:hypothetical protein